MTERQNVYRKTLIKKVHTSARYRNYYAENRDEYEALLLTHFDHNSSAHLSITQLEQLVAYLDEIVPLPEVKRISPQQLYRMGQLWDEKARDKSTTALAKFAGKIARRNVEALAQLTSGEAQKVLVALDKMEG